MCKDHTTKEIFAIVLFSLAFLLGCASANAQRYEYGTPAELKGLTTYGLDTQGNVSLRNKMIEMIAKELPQLKVIDDFNQADIYIMYELSRDTAVTGATQVYNSTIIDTFEYESGLGIVAIDPIGDDPKKLRMIIQFNNVQDNRMEKAPYKKFVKEFIKAYKKGNGMK